MLKFTPDRRLTGGLRLPANKLQSTRRPIRHDFVPERLWISTRQHSGPAAEPVVAIGQDLARGETIARAPSLYAADVHAPLAGRVLAIEARDVPLAARVTRETCIVIAPDGSDRRAGTAGPVALADTGPERLAQLAAAGIVGLGGAVYPTAAKLRPEAPCDCLIINGAECEPYISCDDMLMREAPEAILRGAELLVRIVAARQCIIAIERDKPQAIEAMEAAAERLAIPNLRIAELPSIYPAGGERQLVEVLTGVEVPSSHYPGDFGFLCQNVGTAFAVHNWFAAGEPLLSRVVTVSGSAVAEPGNIEVPIGTPIAELVAACGGYRAETVRLIHGGSMMGFALASDQLPVTKATNCIIVAEPAEVRIDMREWPCIRCGECAIACPARLQPQDLLLVARAADAPGLAALSLEECIECGCCDIVCPSHIPLTEVFRQAKPILRQHEQRQMLADAAGERYRQREERREEHRREDETRRREITTALGDADERGRRIRAAVERARQRQKPVKTDER